MRINRASQRRSAGRACTHGVTLTELMVTIAIIGILAGVTLLITGREWHREQLNSVAAQLESWLDDVRRSSMRGHPCTVTFLTGSKLAGDPMAVAVASPGAGDTNECLSSNPLLRNPFSLDPSLVSGRLEFSQSGPSSFIFTPRGTVLGLPADNSEPMELTLVLEGAKQGHCIRISPPIGDISMGEVSWGASNVCTYPEDR